MKKLQEKLENILKKGVSILPLNEVYRDPDDGTVVLANTTVNLPVGKVHFADLCEALDLMKENIAEDTAIFYRDTIGTLEAVVSVSSQEAIAASYNFGQGPLSKYYGDRRVVPGVVARYTLTGGVGKVRREDDL